jgi:hypothetical protein
MPFPVDLAVLTDFDVHPSGLKEMSMSELIRTESRRSFVKKTAYVAPAILTLKAVPAFASQGSEKGNNGVGNGLDPQPPGNPPVNDGPGTGPGNPGRGGH